MHFSVNRKSSLTETLFLASWFHGKIIKAWSNFIKIHQFFPIPKYISIKFLKFYIKHQTVYNILPDKVFLLPDCITFYEQGGKVALIKTFMLV